MTDYEKLFWKGWNFLFPYGNYRYYVWYLPSILTVWLTLYFWIIVFNLMLHGSYISTDTFVTHMTTRSSVPEWVESIIAILFDIAGYIWLIFSTHTAISLIIDTIVPFNGMFRGK